MLASVPVLVIFGEVTGRQGAGGCVAALTPGGAPRRLQGNSRRLPGFGARSATRTDGKLRTTWRVMRDAVDSGTRASIFPAAGSGRATRTRTGGITQMSRT